MRHVSSSYAHASLGVAAAAGLAALLAAAVPAQAATPLASFELPAPAAGSFSTSTVYGPDGLLYAYDGTNVFRQTAPNGGSFAPLSTGAAPVGGSDAGPIAFTQSGSGIVIGTGGGGLDFLNPASNGRFLTLPAAGGAFTDTTFNVPNQYSFTPLPTASTVAGEANKLVVNQGTATFDGSSVSYFDLVTGANAQVVTGIPGASTDVAFDDLGRLYVGVGFDTAPSQRGEIRRFDVAALDAAFTSGTPLSFAGGTLLNAANNNSGNGLFVSDAGLVFAGAGDEGGLITIAPDGAVTTHALGLNSPTLRYNALTDQFAAVEFDGDVFVYDAAAFVPEPAATAAGLVGFAALGVLARRRGRGAA
jgi:hypothetical protein